MLLLFGCKSNGDSTTRADNIRTGSDGLAVTFVANNPPPVLHLDGKEEDFNVVLQLSNKGAFPPMDRIGELNLKVYLSGYDNEIIDLKLDDRQPTSLEGRSTINPNGGTDIAVFNGKIFGDRLRVNKYDVPLLATLCYHYETIASPQVCIDPEHFSTIKQKKVCEVNSMSLSNQGAPVAVTKIDEEALSSKTRFKITLKNVGNGDVLKSSSETPLEKCDPFGQSDNNNRLTRDDIDLVYVKWVRAGNKFLTCEPFSQSNQRSGEGYVRLINGEGFIICELALEYYVNSKTAFTTPLSVMLWYGYRTTAERKLQIINERIVSGEISPSDNSPRDIPQDSPVVWI